MPIFIKTEIIKKEYIIQKDFRKKVINEHIQWIGNLKRKGINIKSGFLVNELRHPGDGGLLILDIETYEYKFSYCDTVNIEFSTFSEDTYSYYTSLESHLESGEVDIFGGEVVSVYTNVQNGLGALISRNTQIIPLK